MGVVPYVAKFNITKPMTNNKKDKQPMIELEGRMDWIQHSKMNEIDWDKHWKNCKKWEIVEASWRKETLMLEKVNIWLYLSARHMENLKDWRKQQILSSLYTMMWTSG